MKARLTPEVIEKHRELAYRCYVMRPIINAVRTGIEHSFPARRRSKIVSVLAKLEHHREELFQDMENWSAARLADLPGRDIWSLYHGLDEAYGISFRKIQESIHDPNNHETYGSKATGQIRLRRRKGNRYITLTRAEHLRLFFMVLVINNQLKRFHELFTLLPDNQTSIVTCRLKVCFELIPKIIDELGVLQGSNGHSVFSAADIIEAAEQVEDTGFVNSLSCSIAYPPAHLIKTEEPA